jgi:hypothetical protein
MMRILAALAMLCGPLAAQSLQPPAATQPPAQVQPSEADAAAGTSVLRGRVLAADTGAPLRRAQVRLSSTTVLPGGTRENRTASTDADGRYEFKALNKGRYSLTAGKGAYVTLAYGQTRVFEAGKPIELLDGQVLERVDFSLPRGGVITGRVLDEYGEPMSGITVVPLREQTVNGQRRPSQVGRAASTDDLGEFRIFALAPADYLVQAAWRTSTPFAAAAAGDSSGYAPTYYPGTTDAAAAKRVAIGISETKSDLVIVMQPTRTASISGTVTTSAGKPGAGMLSMNNDGGGGPNSAAILHPDGSFVFNGLPPGNYTLRTMNLEGGETATAKVAVAGADIADLILVGAPPASVSGRVVLDAAAAQLVSASAIRLLPTSAEPGPGFGVTPVRVNDDLTFTMKSPPGRMRIVLVNPGGLNVRSVRSSGVDVTDSGIEFKPGEAVTGVEIEITGTITTVLGTVTNSRGDAVKDYTVVVFAQDQSRTKGGLRVVRVGRPDQDGRFKVTSLRPGEYYAIALDHVDGDDPDPDFLQSIEPQATAFSLMEAETKTLDLKLKAKP